MVYIDENVSILNRLRFSHAPTKDHKKVHKQFHQKHGWIHDTMICALANFEVEQNFVHGEAKKLKPACLVGWVFIWIRNLH